MINEELPIKMTEDPMSSADDAKLAQMLRGLPRVNAPADFDIRLRARLTEKRTASPKSQFFPILRFVAPASLLLLIAAFLGFSGIFSTVPTVPEMAAVENEPARNEAFTEPVARVSDSGDTSVAPSPERAEAVPHAAPKNTAARESAQVRSASAPARPDAAGGSVDRTLRSSVTQILPRGLNPEPVIGAEAPSGSEVPVAEILQLLGIAGEVENNVWKIRSVAADSSAAKAGARPGDIITAIDNTKIVGTSVLKGPLTVSSLSIDRNGTPLRLSLRGD